jgi:hypothetical protein
MTMTFRQARDLARKVMYDDQLEAIINLVRAVVASPSDPELDAPLLPTVDPPNVEDEPQTGVHSQGFSESSLPEGVISSPLPPPPNVPTISDYERGWRAGRGAAVRVLEALRGRAAMRTPEETTLSDALHAVTSLEVQDP